MISFKNNVVFHSDLRKLVVGINVKDDVLPARESNFLFTAAFLRMESLEHVKFPKFRVDSDQMKANWESSTGRKLTDESKLPRLIRSGEWWRLSREEGRENAYEYLN